MFVLIVALMYATWSSMFSLAKIALEYAPPLFLTSSRMLLAGFLLVAFLAFKKISLFKFTARQWLLLGLLGVFSIYLTNAFEFWSLQHLTAAKACFIYSLCPFFSAFFSYLHFGEKMNSRKWLGMGIGFLGFLPVLAIQKGAQDLISGIPFLSWPELAMMGAALCTSYGWILLRLIVKNSSISPLIANGVSMLIGGGLALFHSYLVETWAPLPVSSSHFGAFAQIVFLMTFISNILCYNLYGLMLKRFTATFLSFMGLLSPIFASLSGWVFLGESPSPVIFLSTAVVSLGLWMVYSAELRQGYIVKSAKQSAFTG